MSYLDENEIELSKVTPYLHLRHTVYTSMIQNDAKTLNLFRLFIPNELET